MLLLYDLGIYFYSLFVRLASLKSKKALSWVRGRKNILELIEQSLDKNVFYIWFHFASLGEFEQGRPVLEQLKNEDPESRIIITFFSPSGYEIRKNYALADHVFYLPADTAKNAREFIRIVNPQMAVFTKYEYWYHYFDELHKNRIPLLMISGIFRKEQPFFKWYGALHRKMLTRVSYFFVQNETSRKLLSELGITNSMVSGDTRFDRVADNASHAPGLQKVQEFAEGKKVFIAGSTWMEDEKLIATLARHNPGWKFIIAPHEVNPGRILETEKLFPGSIKYSALKATSDIPISELQVLIIDNIGMLSALYQYGHIAYIGGGFGAGIHNTLEAAAFGLPVIFGPNYEKFMEAKQLIEIGAAFTIKTREELDNCMSDLLDDGFRIKSGAAAKEYVRQNTGATQKILDYINQKIL